MILLIGSAPWCRNVLAAAKNNLIPFLEGRQIDALSYIPISITNFNIPKSLKFNQIPFTGDFPETNLFDGSTPFYDKNALHDKGNVVFSSTNPLLKINSFAEFKAYIDSESVCYEHIFCASELGRNYRTYCGNAYFIIERLFSGANVKIHDIKHEGSTRENLKSTFLAASEGRTTDFRDWAGNAFTYVQFNTRRLFDWWFNSNSALVFGELAKHVGVETDSLFTKYEIMFLLLLRDRGVIPVDELSGMVSDWEGTGKYAACQLSGSLNPDILTKKNTDRGLCAIYRTALGPAVMLTPRGLKFCSYVHRRTFDPDLPQRLEFWTENFDQRAAASYIRKLFGRQLKHQRKLFNNHCDDQDLISVDTDKETYTLILNSQYIANERRFAPISLVTRLRPRQAGMILAAYCYLSKKHLSTTLAATLLVKHFGARIVPVDYCRDHYHISVDKWESLASEGLAAFAAERYPELTTFRKHPNIPILPELQDLIPLSEIKARVSAEGISDRSGYRKYAMSDNGASKLPYYIERQFHDVLLAPVFLLPQNSASSNSQSEAKKNDWWMLPKGQYLSYRGFTPKIIEESLRAGSSGQFSELIDLMLDFRTNHGGVGYIFIDKASQIIRVLIPIGERMIEKGFVESLNAWLQIMSVPENVLMLFDLDLPFVRALTEDMAVQLSELIDRFQMATTDTHLPTPITQINDNYSVSFHLISEMLADIKLLSS